MVTKRLAAPSFNRTSLLRDSIMFRQQRDGLDKVLDILPPSLIFRHLLKRAVTADAIREIHRRFCELLPEDLLWVENPDTHERVQTQTDGLDELKTMLMLREVFDLSLADARKVSYEVNTGKHTA